MFLEFITRSLHASKGERNVSRIMTNSYNVGQTLVFFAKSGNISEIVYSALNNSTTHYL